MAEHGASIEIRGLYKIFGRNPAAYVDAVQAGMSKGELNEKHGHVLGLKEIKTDMPAGQIQVVMGLSGSGKSTLTRHINRLIDPTVGEVLVDGVDVAKMNERELREFRRHKTAMVFQKFALLPHRTVLHNTVYGLEVQSVPRPEREAQARKWLERVGLTGFEKSYPNQLSGGMQQRVGLARALTNDAPILLMDEAFSALDPLIRVDMQSILLDLQKEIRKTVVFITHDLDEALLLGDRIAVMSDGRIEQLAAPRELYRQPRTAMVARFVGSGMVFPVDVLDRRPGEVTAQFYGAHFPLRGEASTGDRRLACVRASDLALGGAGSGGFACIVCDLNYKGPVTTVVVSPVSDPSRQFHVDHPGAPPALGERTEISIRDGWLLEEAPA